MIEIIIVAVVLIVYIVMRLYEARMIINAIEKMMKLKDEDKAQ